MTIVVSNNVTNVQVSDSAAARADRLLAEQAAARATGVVPATTGLVRATSIANLRAIAPDTGKNVFVSGYYSDGDGGGGEFYAVTGAAAGFYTDNGGTVIVPATGNGSAAWLRIGTNPTSKMFSGELNVRFFGAFGDGTDSTLALQAAIDAGSNIYLPSGLYKITTALTLHGHMNFYGDGGSSATQSGTLIRAYDCDGLTVPPSSGTADYSFITITQFSLESYSSTTGRSPKLYQGFKTNSVYTSPPTYYSYNIIVDSVNFFGWDRCVWLRGTWYSSVDSIETGECNYGVYIQGRTVNNDILSSQLVVSAGGVAGLAAAIEPDLAYPEGLMVANTLFAGGSYGIYFPIRVLSAQITNCVIDIIADTGISATSSISLLVSNCWIYAVNRGISLGPQSVPQKIGATFTNNYITTTSATGINIFVDYNNEGVTISGGALINEGNYRCVSSVTNDLSVTGAYLSTTNAISILFNGTGNTAANNTGNVNYQYVTRSSTPVEVRAMGGIAFPVTPVANTDAHTLAAYETGVWTPLISQDGLGVSTFTTTAAAGTYTRIGNYVTVIGYYTYSSTGSVANGLALLSGLPFAVYNDSIPSSNSVSIEQSTFDTKRYYMTGVPGYATAVFRYNNSKGNTYGLGGTTSSVMCGVDFPSAGTVQISMTYRCAAY